MVDTPDHTRVLVKSLNLSLPPVQSVVVRGPSGSGKSSILKVLGGLWNCTGRLQRPLRVGRGGIFFVPQQSYTTIGTLRHQVTYPDDHQHYPADASQAELDDYVTGILDHCGLSHLHEHWGLDQSTSWDELLSGGESQRLGFARLFYHKPKYAILDESTSALDEELQTKMLQHVLDNDITMISVAHRPEVFTWHSHYLDLDGQGGIELGPVKGSRVAVKDEEEEAISSRGKGPDHLGSSVESCGSVKDISGITRQKTD